MTVELLARLDDDSFRIKRIKDGKIFTIRSGCLCSESKKLLLEKAKDLKLLYPELEIKVSISKRRKKEGGSYYMKSMTISGRVTLINKDLNVPSPPCYCNIIFFGESQKYEDSYKIISNQAFKLEPTPKGASFGSEPFITSYDSDNKGRGNLGGYKYVGYLIIIADENGKVLQTKTLFPPLKKIIEMNVSIISKIKGYSEGTSLNKSMKKN
jgi:hypothetical protein